MADCGKGCDCCTVHKIITKMYHIQKDASWAGDSPGISLKTNSQLPFLLIDFWCYKIIIVPGPGTNAFSRERPCPTIYKNPNCVELISCPTISKILGTCPHNKACYFYAIFHVKTASQQRVIISIITGNIIYICKISRYVLLSYCTLLRIVQNSNKTKTILIQIQKTRSSHLRCAW